MKGNRRCPAWAVAAFALALCLPVGAGVTSRVSVSSSGEEADAGSHDFSLTKNGRYAGFTSDATNLVPDDGNERTDVFVHDLKKGVTTRVSVSSEGAEGDGPSTGGHLSHNGRYAVFHSDATNLVPDDTNGFTDVFVHDRKTGVTERISLSPSGDQADGNCNWPAISGNGRFVSYSSIATNLVPGDENTLPDVFVHDRKTGATTRISVGNGGFEGDGNSGWATLSRSGRHVVFRSNATNIVDGDTNGAMDVFLRDRRKGTTTLVSATPAGEPADAETTACHISANGRIVAFVTRATNLVPGDSNGAQHVFVRDVKRATTTLISTDDEGNQGTSDSYHAWLSPEGRYVAISSASPNLVPEDTNGWHDVFLYDRKKRAMTRVSVDPEGGDANGDSWRPRVSGRARVILFYSWATDLVAGDTNDDRDVFVFERRK